MTPCNTLSAKPFNSPTTVKNMKSSGIMMGKVSNEEHILYCFMQTMPLWDAAALSYNKLQTTFGIKVIAHKFQETMCKLGFLLTLPLQEVTCHYQIEYLFP